MRPIWLMTQKFYGLEQEDSDMDSQGFHDGTGIEDIGLIGTVKNNLEETRQTHEAVRGWIQEKGKESASNETFVGH